MKDHGKACCVKYLMTIHICTTLIIVIKLLFISCHKISNYMN